MANTETLSLKWGTLKSWHLTTDASRAAFSRYRDAGKMSLSAMAQHDNTAQKTALCELIDVLDSDQVYLDWDGKYVSKEEAKEYVRNYDH